MDKKYVKLFCMCAGWSVLTAPLLVAPSYFKNHNIRFWRDALTHLVRPSPPVSTALHQGGDARQMPLPILLYHGIVEYDDGTNVRWQTFAAHVRTLKAAGYETVDLSALISATPLPAKPLIITFSKSNPSTSV